VSARQILTVALYDLRRLLRVRETLLWLLIMPLPFTFFFGIAFRSDPEERATPVVIVDPSPDAGSERVVAALSAAGYEVTVVEQWASERLMPRGGYRIDMPPGLGMHLAEGRSGELVIWTREGDLEARRLEALMQRVLWGARADLLTARLDGSEDLEPTLGRASDAPRITVTTADWGRRREVPSGFKQSIPGNMVMFVLMALLVTGAIRLMEDRQAGTLRRMLSYPMSASAVVAAQMLSLILTGLAESAYFLLISKVLFRVSFGGRALAVAAVLGLFVVAMSGAGALLGSLVKNVQQASAIGVFASLGLAALGGCWWPIEIVPPVMKTVAMALPTGQTMHALVRLMVWGDPVVELAGAALYLVAFAAVAGTAAVLVLRRRID